MNKIFKFITAFFFLSILFYFLFKKKSDYVLKLNGIDEYLSVTSIDTKAIDINDEATIEARIKINNTEGYVAIANKHWCQSSRGGFHFGVRNGKLTFVWTENGNCNFHASVITTKEIIKEDEWVSVAVVFDKGNVNLFVDGEIQELIKKGDLKKINNAQIPLLIGAYRKLNGDYLSFFNGKIDNLRLWNKARSDQEIKNFTKKSITQTESNLLLNLTFDKRQLKNLGSQLLNVNCNGEFCDDPSKMIIYEYFK